MKPIIIVGTGLAGYTLAREFRKLNRSVSLLMVTADDGSFYSKPMLSNAIAQGKQAGQLVTRTAAQMAGEVGATILTSTRVVRIDSAKRKLETSSGTFEYASLVLAVGAQPVRPSIAGDASDEVITINHLKDYARFRQRMHRDDRRAHVTILGAGLIGCEFADDLAGAEHQVALVDPNALALAALAPPVLSQGLQAALVQRGVGFHLETTVTEVNRHDDGLEIRLANGQQILSDVVLSAVGLRPDLQLAHAAQLRTARGIVVDEYGQTSEPGIYALGDCAEYAAAHTSCLLPYIAPLMTAARTIARTLAGEPVRMELKPSPIIVKTPSFPLALMPPPAGINREKLWLETQVGTHIVCRYYDHEGVMVGFGVSPQETGIRQSLLAELGSKSFHVT